MSVINQMLKDLDERQNEQTVVQNTPIPIAAKTSSKKMLFSIVSVIVLINIVGIVIWQLYTENQNLRSESKAVLATVENKQAKETTTIPPSEATAGLNATKTLENNLESATVKLPELVDTKRRNSAMNEDKQVTENNAIPKSDSQNSNYVAEQESRNPDELNTAEVEPLIDKPKPQLSISRKQLTAKELTAQKITQAERALQANDLNKAEKLFEDVLLVSPENRVARKQLAALWFGRQSYQAALNLLSQGIALTPDNMEYRLMKARIYLSQGQTIAAVNVLKVLTNLENVEYQSLLASSAQQAKTYQVAAHAYRLLSTMQPNVGRWWLGLAVALDSNSQFSEAADAYQSTLSSTELSENARQFARQRLQELGG